MQTTMTTTTTATPLLQHMGLGPSSPTSPLLMPQSRFPYPTTTPSPMYHHYNVSPNKRPRSSPSPSPPRPTKRPAFGLDDECSSPTLPSTSGSLPSTPLGSKTFPPNSPNSENMASPSPSPSPLYNLPPPQILNLTVKNRPNTHTNDLHQPPTTPAKTPYSSVQKPPIPVPVQYADSPADTVPGMSAQTSEVATSAIQQEYQPRIFRYRDNPDLPEDDPWAPLPYGVYDGYEGRPLLKYWSVRDREADDEFNGLAGRKIADLMDKKYKSFAVLLTHVGYTRRLSAPAILVIAKQFSSHDVTEIMNFFGTMGCRRIRGVFCYEGSLGRNWRHEYDLRVYQQRPNPGSSIGIADQEGSFTLGMYLRLSGDPSTYALTVAHGLPNFNTPITPTTTPKVVVEQPSPVDIQKEIDALEIQFENATTLPGVQKYNEPQYYQNQINKFKELKEKARLGEIAYSDVCVVNYREAPTNVDWALIKVDDTRVGINYVQSDVINHNDKYKWVPRNERGIFFSGHETLELGIEVSKTGQATGSTMACIDLRYALVKLDTPTYTTEYTIVNESSSNRFSEPGDLGAPVFDIKGRVCGMVIGGSDEGGKELTGTRYTERVWVSYVSPMQLLMERIKIVTGRDVEVVVADLSKFEGVVQDEIEEGAKV